MIGLLLLLIHLHYIQFTIGTPVSSQEIVPALEVASVVANYEAPSLHQDNDAVPKIVAKRSTDSERSYDDYDDQSNEKIVREYRDHGYPTYMYSQWPAMLPWNKRDGYRGSMQAVGNDPSLAFGKRTGGYDSYMHGVGYNPFNVFKRTEFDREEPYGRNFYPMYLYNEYTKRETPLPEYIENRPRSTRSLLSDDSGHWKRGPHEMGSRGFHEGIFTQNFGDFYPMKRNKRKVDKDGEKRNFGMGTSGFYGDTFSNGFGDFSTMRKRIGMGASGFHGDTFSDGFGGFSTMRKRPDMDSSGFYGDTFTHGFGDFSTMRKRRPEMNAMGFHGDTFNSGFGDFYPMKKALQKRRPEMTSSGFHGDTFSSGFGDFSPMKKNEEEEERKLREERQKRESAEVLKSKLEEGKKDQLQKPQDSFQNLEYGMEEKQRPNASVVATSR